MKKHIINFLLLSLFCLRATAQPPAFNLNTIPEAVKTKASVIVSLEDIDLKVESPENATLTVHKIFTVLNEEGKAALLFTEYSAKNISSLDEAEIKVFDASGKTREKIRKKEMMTHSIGEGLIEDGYVTYYVITSTTYPVTVEFNYKKKIKSTLFIPDYRFITAGEGIIESHYTARVPAEIGLKFKAINTTLAPTISVDGNTTLYQWNISNMAPIKYEEGTVSDFNKYPRIAIAANNFSYYGFHGDLSTWKSFGAWMHDLYTGLDSLSPERKQFFMQLVKDAPSEKEKISRIYSYLQQNFRYVSIQLGIGGLRPFSAEFTDQKKYGDCKALSNYMKAALKCVGIKSYVAIINSDYNQLSVDPGFPAYNFNHVILCVPGAKDSIWLECTSQTIDFGQLGTFTENRNALLVTDEGGVLVPTPASQPAANTFSAFTTVVIQDDLSAVTKTVFNGGGEYKQMINEMLKEQKDDQKEDIVTSLGFKQPDEFELKAGSGNKPQLILSLRSISEFNTANKWFISPRIYKMWPRTLPTSENRKFDFYFHFPFEKYDTTIFRLPPSLKVDVMPAEKELKCDYGIYRSKCWYNESENAIYTTAFLRLKQHKIPAADYAQVKKFFDQLMQDDAQKIMLKKVN
jgi:Domain of Unknown Function with PDB structure (DUF3857)/Transglutaminase-like superfamily